MKRLLFVVPYLSTGGTNRSLQCLLSFMDTDRYDIDVFALAGDGVYKDHFTNCTLLPASPLIDSIIGRFENKRGFGRVLGLISKTLCKLTNYKFQHVAFSLVANQLCKKGYDAVIAYSEGVATEFVGTVKHRNKIAWIHCDYASYYGQNGCKNENSLYESFKSIVCVSQFTRKSFLSFYPNLNDKTTSINNLLDVDMMKRLSKEETDMELDSSKFNIVSVGRIDPVKQMSAIPAIAARLRARSLNIRWYIIGPKGTDKEYNLLKDNIKEYDCQDYVLLLGEKSNPYPYIRKANLLVVPSKSEACPYVVNEAKVLGTPVVVSDFGSAPEFVTNGDCGFVVPLDKMADIMAELVIDNKKYQEICENLLAFDYDNAGLLNQVNSLCDA